MIATPAPTMMRALPAEHCLRLMRMAREVSFPAGHPRPVRHRGTGNEGSS